LAFLLDIAAGSTSSVPATTAAVVKIVADTNDPSTTHQGSGFIAAPGTVITCLHVIDNSPGAVVIFPDGRQTDVIGVTAVERNTI
jgi:hypothetical protein